MKRIAGKDRHTEVNSQTIQGADLLRLFSGNVRKILETANLDFDKVQEIRLRTGAPLLVVYAAKEQFPDETGTMQTDGSRGYVIRAEDIRDTMEYIGNYSLYAYEEELRQGFLTVQGGHRVGIAGKTILEGERVKGISHISCINVRIAHQLKGCADMVLPYLMDGNEFHHTLIVSAPRCGKTTLLRDIIRQISDGSKEFPGLTVGVVDERSEIAGCYLGVAQNDIGIRTDVLDCCPKAEGMMMLIRSMSPDVVAVDEIGTSEDIHAMESVVNCGCKLLATVHGNSIEDIKQKPLLCRLVEEHVFERYVVLGGQPRIGSVQAIFDGRGTTLYRREVCS
ncbi:MAG: stage III sporulation protein AA [Fusicatenibacter sp.]|nr:stage III sporulation protein AA [Lachnospiraceae bacterium]MDY2937401.1 stage III sporulation protein AA [Fusicatenibacter sp.]